MGLFDLPIEKTSTTSTTLSKPSSKGKERATSADQIFPSKIFGNGTPRRLSIRDIQKINSYLNIINPNSKPWDQLTTEEQQEVFAKYESGALKKESAQKTNEKVTKLQNCKTTDEAINTMLEELLSLEDTGFKNLSGKERAEKIAKKRAEVEAQISASGKNKSLIDVLFYCYFQGYKLTKANIDESSKNYAVKKFLSGMYNKCLGHLQPPKENTSKSKPVSIREGHQKDLKKLENALYEKELAKGKKPEEINSAELLYKELIAKQERGEELNEVELDSISSFEKELQRTGSIQDTSAFLLGDKDEESLLTQFLEKVLVKDNKDARISLQDITEEQKEEITKLFLEEFNQCQSKEEQIDLIKCFYMSNNDAASREFAMEIVARSNIDHTLVREAAEELKKDNLIEPEVLDRLELLYDSIMPEEKDSGSPNESGCIVMRMVKRVMGKAFSSNMVTDYAQNSDQLDGDGQKFFGTEGIGSAVEEGLMTQATASTIMSNVVATGYDAESAEFVLTEMGAKGYLKNNSTEAMQALKDRGEQARVERITEAWATNENMDAELKNTMFRDLIEFTDDEDLKNYFENLAKQHSIDYNSAPPRSERVTTSSSTTNSSGENVANSSYNTYNTSNILNRNDEPDFFSVLTANIKNGIDGTIETLSTIFESPDAKPQQKLNSFDDALSALNEAGMQKLPKIFAQSSIGVKQELIKYVFTQNKDDIIPLIKSFGGVAIFTLTEGSSKKMFIYQETKKLAMNDSALKPDVKAMEQMLKKAQSGQMDLTII